MGLEGMVVFLDERVGGSELIITIQAGDETGLGFPILFALKIGQELGCPFL